MSARGKIAVLAVAVAAGAFAGRARAATYIAPGQTTARYAFVTNLGSGSVSEYVVDPTTGFLKANGAIRCSSGGQAISVTTDPLSKFVMASTFGTGAMNALISYTLDARGRLVQQGSVSPFAGPNDFTFSLDSKSLYFPDLDGNFLDDYAVNTSTGALTAPASVGTGNAPETIAVHPTQSIAYVLNYIDNTIGIYSVAASGALTETTTAATRIPVGTGAPGPVSMAVSRNGSFLFAAAYDTSAIYGWKIGAAGALTPIIQSGTNTAFTHAGVTNPASLVIDNTSSFLYTADDGANNVSYWTITAGTGVLTWKANYAAGGNPNRLSTDASGQYLYSVNRTSNDITIFQIQAGGTLNTTAPYPFTVRAQQQPYDIAVTAGTAAATFVPKFAYCSNSLGDTISMYSIASGGANPGILTALNPATVSSVGHQPLWIEIEPSGRWLYSICRNDGGSGTRGIQQYAIDGTTGQLTATGALVATDAGPRRFAIEPSGRFLYLTHDTAKTVGIYSIDQTTGALTRLAGTLTFTDAIWGITVDVTGQYVLIADQTAATTSSYSINQATGALTFVNTSPAGGTTPYTVRNDPSGKFVYVGNSATNEWDEYGFTSGGVFSTIGSVSAAQGLVIQIDLHPSSQYAYSANFNANSITAFNVNTASGALTNARTIGTGNAPQGLIVEPSGQYIYVPNSGSNNITMLSINQTNGNLSNIGGGTVNAGNGPHTVTVFGVLQ